METNDPRQPRVGWLGRLVRSYLDLRSFDAFRLAAVNEDGVQSGLRDTTGPPDETFLCCEPLGIVG
jgi:hypothetical protein